MLQAHPSVVGVEGNMAMIFHNIPVLYQAAANPAGLTRWETGARVHRLLVLTDCIAEHCDVHGPYLES